MTMAFMGMEIYNVEYFGFSEQDGDLIFGVLDDVIFERSLIVY